MASVHYGRLSGTSGFSRVVAIKRLHANFAKDPEFVSMFLDEARVVARIRHPNVVPCLDVVTTEGEVFLVMEYVHGESLAKVWRSMCAADRHLDPRIAATIMSGVLQGLHAAHEATGEHGESLHIVHRDVSPQNILVSVDGAARVLDFGVAKAAGRVHTTQEGHIKGKLAYMPPEQLHGTPVTRTADVYAAAVVLWELLTGQRAFRREHEAAIIAAILSETLRPPSQVAPHVPAAFDRVVMRGLDRNPQLRYSTAEEMAHDLEQCAGTASMSEVGQWVDSYAHDDLARRARRIAAIEVAPVGPDAEAARTAADDTPTKPAWKRPANPSADGPSGISRVAVSSTVRRLRRRGRAALLTVASGVLALVTLFAFMGEGRHDHSASTPRADLPGAGVDPRVAVTLPQPQNPSPAPTSVTVALPSLVNPPLVGPAPGNPSPADPRPTSSPRAAHTAGSPHATRSDCDPPFTIDQRGRKHYKSACL
ncbi:MAG: protein kinase [Myxococcota bacterium]|nr:protein kinase [Myxococcota bacterium]